MGPSRYASLVKLKKKSLEEAERDLLGANNDVNAAAQRLEDAYEVLRALSLPAQGSIRELSQANSMIQTQHRMIDQHQEVLETARRRQHAMRELFESSRTEYEKFSYLEVQEHKERLKKLKEQEAKMLDEIGTIMHKREKR